MGKNVTVVLDAQAGSCGKGKFIGYLARKDGIDIAINNFMSNAGHTYIGEDGYKIMTQHLPTSMVWSDTTLVIGPGSAITPAILFDEIIRYIDIIGERKLYIHPRAAVILPEHAKKEREILRSGSTFKGCGAAQSDKLMRIPDIQLFGDWYTKTDWTKLSVPSGNHSSIDSGIMLDAEQISTILSVIEITDTMELMNTYIDSNGLIMIEGSQGCDLDINYGLNYPHTTSRQCHAGQLVADCGISPRMVDEIIMIMRPYPIRISNQTNIGLEISSGDYDGAEEITWDIVKERCGAPADVEFGEMTTVTKKMRRVFEMNWERLTYVSKLNRPTQIALNFVQYLDWDALYCKRFKDLPTPVLQFIHKVQDITGVPVTLIGTGPNNDHIIDIRK